MLYFPLDTIYITQHFGERPQIYKPFKGHTGIDFRTIFKDSPNGKRAVTSATSCIISEIGDQGTKGYGRFIRTKQDDGSEIVYGHLTDWYVQKNEQVKAGTKIALSGNSGFSSAAHLHFGFRPKNFNYNNGFAGYIDPLPLFSKTYEAEIFHSTPYSLLKKRGEPAIYLYGHDNLWHPLENMDILTALTGTYNKANVQVVDILPSNLGDVIYSLKALS